jgi:hypothetical protein
MKKTNVVVQGKTVYANANTGNVKLTTRGAAQPIGNVFAMLPKGEARKVRKQLRSEGYPALAAARRAA